MHRDAAGDRELLGGGEDAGRRPRRSWRTWASTAPISDGTISPWPIPIRAVARAVSQPVS